MALSQIPSTFCKTILSSRTLNIILVILLVTLISHICREKLTTETEKQRPLIGATIPTGGQLDRFQAWKLQRKALLQTSQVRKLFLFAYMRGGSTLLYKLFDQDPDAIAWYEPLAPLYGLMYGLPQARNYKHIVFNEDFNSNQLSFRHLCNWETEEIISYLKKLYSCDLHNLHREVFSNSFLTHGNSFQKYLQCFHNNKNKCQQKWEHNCLEKSGISGVCRTSQCGTKSCSFVRRSEHNICPQLLKVTRTESRANILANVTTESLYAKILSKGFDYKQCMGCVNWNVYRCLRSTGLPKQCEQRKVRVAKVLRLKMPSMEPIIQAMPDLHIVYYIRDPRAIANSRIADQGGFKKSQNLRIQMWIAQTVALCEEMLEDRKTVLQLQGNYPGLIMRYKYENLVSDPSLSMLDRLYRQISKRVPGTVRRWLTRVLNSSQKEERYGVHRHNATKTAGRWRDHYPQWAINRVSKHTVCKTLLDAEGYK